MSVISMKQLLEAGVHFGHQTRKWNPKMKKYIFTARNDIHIINLESTSLQVDKAYTFVRDIVASGKNVLFVGTKKQAQEAVKEEAERCGMFYVNTRWLGGCLTNFKTIKSRVERLNKLNQMEKVGEFDLLPKKEVTLLKSERDKLEKNLGGIKEMRELPGLVFVVDPSIEHICVHECPEGIDYVIPGNDDAIRSVKLIASAIADAVIEAREGVSMKKDEVEDEKIDLEKALTETKPNLEIAEAGEENRSKKPAKKKPIIKKKVEEKTEPATEPQEVKEEKPVKKAKVEKVEEVEKPAKTEKPAPKTTAKTAKPATKTTEKTEEKPTTKTTKTTTKKEVKGE